MGDKESIISRFLKTWHNHPLFVSIITVIITLLVTQVGGCWQSCADARRKDAALKLAFSGEISAIRGVLEYTARNAREAFRQGKMLKHHQIVYSDKVFEANASGLGNLQDRELIKQISTLYSLVDRTNEIARRIDEGIYDASSFPTFLRTLANCWRIAILLDMRLQMETKDYTDLNWQVVFTKKDEDDKKLADQMIQELDKEPTQ